MTTDQKRPKQTLKREFWREDERKIWVKKQPKFGWGWTVNFAELKRRLKDLRPR